MKRVLYLRTSSMQCDPHVNSLTDAANGEFEVGIYDYFTENSNEAVLKISHEWKPTHVVCLGVCGGPYQITKETFQEVRKDAKVIFLCPEASHPDWNALIQDYTGSDSFDLVVSLDGSPNWDCKGKQLTTLAIYDQRPYADYSDYDWDHRPIPVGFCGGYGHPGTMRHELITHLKNFRMHNGISLLSEFSFIENPGTYQLYADFMKMSKIIVNPAGSSSDLSKHVKGRVVEAGLAGCTLIEEEGSPIHLWFSEDCYFSFKEPYHCHHVINDLLANPDKAKHAAQRLSIEVREKYSPTKLWGDIFGLLA